MPIDADFNSALWRLDLHKEYPEEWNLEINDSQDYLGEITYTTQIIDSKFLGISFTINFKNKDTEQMKLGVQVRDTKHGVRNFYFNEGVQFLDSHAYPYVETAFNPPLKIEPLCREDSHNNRETCGFSKIRENEIKRAQETLEKIMNHLYSKY